MIRYLQNNGGPEKKFGDFVNFRMLSHVRAELESFIKYPNIVAHYLKAIYTCGFSFKVAGYTKMSVFLYDRFKCSSIFQFLEPRRP